MSIKEKLTKYTDLYKEILKCFEIIGHLPLEDFTDHKWISINEKEMLYLKFNDDEYEEYGFDYANPIGSKDGFHLFYINENGENFYGIFNEVHKLTEKQYQILIKA